jgi:hypothetical protein
MNQSFELYKSVILFRIIVLQCRINNPNHIWCGFYLVKIYIWMFSRRYYSRRRRDMPPTTTTKPMGGRKRDDRKRRKTERKKSRRSYMRW